MTHPKASRKGDNETRKKVVQEGMTGEKYGFFLIEKDERMTGVMDEVV